MSELLRLKDISASVQAWWRDEYPLAVTTIWPGTVMDAAALGEWLEFWIDGWSREPQRAGSPQRIELSLTVHCFVQSGADKGRVYALADAARQTLSQATIPVRRLEESGQPVIGYSSIFEPEIRDMSRNQGGSLQRGVQHLVLTWRGVAQRSE